MDGVCGPRGGLDDRRLCCGSDEERGDREKLITWEKRRERTERDKPKESEGQEREEWKEKERKGVL